MPWYFAYGSNMQIATFRGRRGIEFARALPARLPGWRLVLDKPPLLPLGEGFANIIVEPASEVFGVLYDVSDEAIASIDLSEGVLIGNYARIEVAAHPFDADVPPLTAFTLTSDRRDATLQPSTRYMTLLIEGALEHGLPGAYVELLRRIPTGVPTAEALALRPYFEEGIAALRSGRG